MKIQTSKLKHRSFHYVNVKHSVLGQGLEEMAQTVMYQWSTAKKFIWWMNLAQAYGTVQLDMDTLSQYMLHHF